MARDIDERAARHAALGETVRLAIVEDLVHSDRSPSELGDRFTMPSSLVAHHLDVLEAAELVERFVSTGDRRRRYVRARVEPLASMGVRATARPFEIVFVCSHNSARSQLAAALWTQRTGRPASSVGTQPAAQVHRQALAAARRAGLDLSAAKPRLQRPSDLAKAELVVTVCDHAHEELQPDAAWWHWSLPDPVEDGSPAAFDRTVAELDVRMRTCAGSLVRSYLEGTRP